MLLATFPVRRHRRSGAHCRWVRRASAIEAARQGQADLRHPRGSDRTHVAANTIRRWIKRYRYGGFDAALPQAANRPGAAPAASSRGRRAPRRAEGQQPGVVGAQGHPEGPRGRRGSSARPVHRTPAPQPRGPVRQEAARRRRPPPLRLQGSRRAVDERRHARAQGPARPNPAQDLPHRLHRRRHPRHPVCRLRLGRKRPGLPAGVQERPCAPRTRSAPVRR